MVGQGPRQGFKVAGRSVANIRDAAVRARSLLGVTGPRFDAERTLERLTNYGVTVDVLAERDPELPRDVEACWVPDIVTLMLKESVYIGACSGTPRALFTVAHELGHLVLAHRRIAFNRDTGARCEIWQDSEWQANQFAAEFLMPLVLIRQASLASPQAIQTTFGVSSQAAQTRFAKLKERGEI